MFQKVLIQWWQ